MMQIEGTADDQSEQQPLRAAQQLADEQEQAHQSGHQDHRFDVVHGSLHAGDTHVAPGGVKEKERDPVRSAHRA